MKVTQAKRERESGVELLKLIALFVIVVGHVMQTLISENPFFDNSYVFHVGEATTDYRSLLLCWLSAAGEMGNDIFFVCSCWYLLDSKKTNLKKVLYLIADVWVVNALFLAVFQAANLHELYPFEIIQCLFPTTYGLNWYITCYMLFYLIHPFLNMIIDGISQKVHLTANLIALVLYCVINYISPGHFFVNKIVGFVIIYFFVAYMKLYLMEFTASKSKNLICFFVGFLGLPLLILAVNFLGFKVGFLSDKLIRWGGFLSPFVLLTALSLLNLFKRKVYVNRFINSVAGMTMLIYLFHENYLFREYIRPRIWMYIYENFGYDHVIPILFVFSILQFLAAVILSAIYKVTLDKLVKKVSFAVGDKIGKWYDGFSEKVMRLK